MNESFESRQLSAIEPLLKAEVERLKSNGYESVGALLEEMFAVQKRLVAKTNVLQKLEVYALLNGHKPDPDGREDSCELCNILTELNELKKEEKEYCVKQREKYGLPAKSPLSGEDLRPGQSHHP